MRQLWSRLFACNFVMGRLRTTGRHTRRPRITRSLVPNIVMVYFSTGVGSSCQEIEKCDVMY